MRAATAAAAAAERRSCGRARGALVTRKREVGVKIHKEDNMRATRGQREEPDSVLSEAGGTTMVYYRHALYLSRAFITGKNDCFLIRHLRNY